MKPRSYVAISLQCLLAARQGELFTLERLRHESRLIRFMEHQSMARLAGLGNKIAWEMRQRETEAAT